MWLDSLHADLCANHLPPDQEKLTDAEFDLNKRYGRKTLGE